MYLFKPVPQDRRKVMQFLAVIAGALIAVCALVALYGSAKDHGFWGFVIALGIALILFGGLPALIAASDGMIKTWYDGFLVAVYIGIALLVIGAAMKHRQSRESNILAKW
jgi:peptidoglycan/LPS O-acetylase OafA/YrhL